uniref:Hemolysin activation/secretion protein n=1 Tax=Candidatus Kentrum sp. LFY TaxID=2126342 RepID=A0A450WNB1_9GAMM|nr:MAG: Hemolysin activation/secretion protein [Candidatus Kentron sp. LFY]
MRRNLVSSSNLKRLDVVLPIVILGIFSGVIRAETTRSSGYAHQTYVQRMGPSTHPLRLPPVVPDQGKAPSSPNTDDISPFVLQGIHFDGNTVFNATELMALAKPYMGRLVSFTDLEDIRIAITRHYESAGYPNSGALLPSQHIEDGQVRFRIIEGRLDTVHIRGSGHLNPEYIRGRLLWGLTNQPLNSKALGERFRLLLTDPLIARLQGTLRPGEKIGSGILDLDVTTADSLDLGLSFDNHRSVSTGADTGRLVGNLRNFTGWGDDLALTLGRSQGALEGSIAWTVPVSPRDTRITIYHSKSRATVIEEPLNKIDIDNLSRRWGIGFDYPLWRWTTGHLRLGAKFEHEFSRTLFLGRGWPLSSGVEANGSAQVSVLRFVQDYALRTKIRSFAARSTVSLGIDAFDATIHDDNKPDSRFVSWVGQARQAWRLKRNGQKRDDRIVLRADLQWTNDSLLPLEQFAVGGANSVRGYRENQLVRDQGYVASIEYRHSLLTFDNPHDLKLVLFSDIGGGRYRDKHVSDSLLWSIGIGMRWKWKRLRAAIDWGCPLRSVPEPFEHDLQDDGVHFSLSFDLL